MIHCSTKTHHLNCSSDQRKDSGLESGRKEKRLSRLCGKGSSKEEGGQGTGTGRRGSQLFRARAASGTGLASSNDPALLFVPPHCVPSRAPIRCWAMGAQAVRGTARRRNERVRRWQPPQRRRVRLKLHLGAARDPALVQLCGLLGPAHQDGDPQHPRVSHSAGHLRDGGALHVPVRLHDRLRGRQQ